MDAHGRSLTRRLQNDGQGNGRPLISLDNLPVRGRYLVLPELLLGANLVERGLAPLNAFAGIWDTSLLQNSLKTPVFTKSAVNGVETQVDIRREIEVLAF